MATIKARVGVTFTADDGTALKINEGDIVRNLVYRNTAKETVSIDEAAVRVICATTKAQSTGPTDCPPEPYVYKYITPTMFVLDSSDENNAILTRVNTSDIISIGEVVSGDVIEGAIVVGTGAGYKSLDEVISEASDGAVIQLEAGEYTAALSISKSVSIIGTSGTVLSGAINLTGASTLSEDSSSSGITVQIDGVELTGDALVTVNSGIDTFSLTNCTFEGHNIANDSTKVMPIAVTSDDPITLIIDDNKFGDENNASYNLIDVYGKLKDGSSLSGNTFTASSCRHNIFSLYGLDDNATVSISNNYAEVSKNMLRIGFKGAPVGTVLLEGNSYDETDSDPKWAGLFLVQPYGKQTTSFAGLTIKVNNTTYPEGTQLGYIYAGSSDTQWTDDNKPVIYVDGELVDIPDAS